MAVIEGDESANVLNGTDADDQIFGRGGDDFLYGGLGNDAIVGGDGNDQLFGGFGRDVLSGGAGNDTVWITTLGDVVSKERIDGGTGFDTIAWYPPFFSGGGEVDLSAVDISDVEAFDSGRGTLTVFAMTAAQLDAVIAVSGLFRVTTPGDITFGGVAGNIRLTLSESGNGVDLTGFDAFDVRIIGGAGADRIIAGAEAVILSGGGGDDTLIGGARDDMLTGGSGADVMRGEAGDDTFFFVADDVVAGEVIDGGAGYDRLQLDEGSLDLSAATLVGVEVIAAFNAQVTMTLKQFDAIEAASGHFVLTTGGRLSLAGIMAFGVPQLSFTLSDASTTIDLRGTLPMSFTVTGGRSDDQVIGADRADMITGGGGNDTLIGNGGDDTLDGGTGIDRLAGGAGNDQYFVDSATDRVTELFDSGDRDRIFSTVSYYLPANVEGLSLIGTGDVNAIGNALGNALLGNDVGSNRLDGRAGDDTLEGLGGDDLLIGGLGSDHMEGGLGNDTFVVDSVGDTVVEFSDQGDDTINAQIDFTLPDNVERLALFGRARNGTGNALDNVLIGGGGADTLKGLDGDDAIQGNDGADQIHGGAGNDTLFGGLGRDVMTGGLGADRFVFRSGDSGRDATSADRITDFNRAEGDRISLGAIDANGVPPDTAFMFVGTAAFSGLAGELRYGFIGADTLIQADTNGDGLADFAIRLTGNINLTSSDFVL